MPEHSEYVPVTSSRHPREVLTGIRGIQRYAVQNPQRSSLLNWFRLLNSKDRQSSCFRTSEGFQALYTVKDEGDRFLHTVSGKSKILPLGDQIEAMGFIMLELNRQFEQAGVELRLNTAYLRRTSLKTMCIQFLLPKTQHQQVLAVLDQLPPLKGD